jgi:hypothetical protein
MPFVAMVIITVTCVIAVVGVIGYLLDKSAD